jgi:hypothetical protein
LALRSLRALGNAFSYLITTLAHKAGSVANFWKMIVAKSAEKFGRWRTNQAAHIIFSLGLF